MKAQVDLNSVYALSEDVVAREVSGEFIIIPISSGIGDLEDEIFSLNETGQAIWKKMDGKRTLKEIIDALALDFSAPAEDIKKDVLGLVSELLKRRMFTSQK